MAALLSPRWMNCALGAALLAGALSAQAAEKPHEAACRAAFFDVLPVSRLEQLFGRKLEAYVKPALKECLFAFADAVPMANGLQQNQMLMSFLPRKAGAAKFEADKKLVQSRLVSYEPLPGMSGVFSYRDYGMTFIEFTTTDGSWSLLALEGEQPKAALDAAAKLTMEVLKEPTVQRWLDAN
jgi:hypothetical protein